MNRTKITRNAMDEPRYSGIPTFMRTPLSTDLEALDIGLVGVPYDGAVEARSGARQAELHRLKGEFLLGVSLNNCLRSETCFKSAFKIARNRGAKVLELRAAMSFCNLREKKGGGKEEAKKLVADTYAWFTEGFDTPDLRNAKELIDES